MAVVQLASSPAAAVPLAGGAALGESLLANYVRHVSFSVLDAPAASQLRFVEVVLRVLERTQAPMLVAALVHVLDRLMGGASHDLERIATDQAFAASLRAARCDRHVAGREATAGEPGEAPENGAEAAAGAAATDAATEAATAESAADKPDASLASQWAAVSRIMLRLSQEWVWWWWWPRWQWSLYLMCRVSRVERRSNPVPSSPRRAEIARMTLLQMPVAPFLTISMRNFLWKCLTPDGDGDGTATADQCALDDRPTTWCSRLGGGAECWGCWGVEVLR